jgi:predicted nucleic acid-binding protein
MARLRRGVGGALVLDAQGLAKLAAGDPVVRGHIREARAHDFEVVTAASSLVEVLRGGPSDAPVHQALKHVTVTAVDEEIGRKAGELLGAAGMPGHKDALDSLLAATALAQQRPVLLLTGDPADMARLTGQPDRDKAGRVAVIAV